MPILIAPKLEDGVDSAVKFDSGKVSTSGMYAPAVGIHLGYEKIILAGIPFDNTGHFYRPITVPNDFYGEFTKVKEKWAELRRRSKNKIRAVSGNLVECFGELTDEWLNE